MDPFLKVFIEFVTIVFLFYVLAFWLWGMWDLSSPTRDWTQTPCTGRSSLNHWTAREVLHFFIFIFIAFAFGVISKTITKTDVTGVPWFQVLHLSLSSILNLGGMMIQL